MIRKGLSLFGAICAAAIIYDIAKGPRMSAYERGYLAGCSKTLQAQVNAALERKR